MNTIGKKSFTEIFLVIFFSYIVFDILALTTHNNDWDVFLHRYETGYASTDYLFDTMNIFFNKCKIEFMTFFRICQFVTYYLIFYTFYRFCNDKFILFTLLLLTLIAPHINILMQYYLGFSVLLLSSVAYVNNNTRTSIALIIISIGIHTGLLIFMPMFYILYKMRKRIVTSNKMLGRLLLFSLIFFISFNFLFFVAERLGLGVFVYYKDWEKSSISAAIFMGLIYYPWFIYSLYIHYKNEKKIGKGFWKSDKVYKLLLASNYLPFLYLFLSNVMIIQFRVLEPLLILAFMFIIYSKKYYKLGKSTVLSLCSLMISGVLLKYFFLGYIKGGISEWVEHYTEIVVFNYDSIILNLFR